MISDFYKVRYFYLLYFGFALVSLGLITAFSKQEIHLTINAYHSHFWDVFFQIYTHIGEGTFAIIISLLLVLYSIRSFLFSITTTIFTGLLVGLIKRVFFYGEPRPLTLLRENPKLYIIPGFEPNEINSFPSGHSASIFALMLCLCFFIKNEKASVPFFFVSLLVCYSRLYLSEHFLIDVLAGATIGILVTSAVGYVFLKYGKRLS